MSNSTEMETISLFLMLIRGYLQFMDGYFVHFLAPEGVKPMPMDIVFVLDKSGSMGGTKMTQLQDSMKKILDDVKADDKIMIIAFDSNLSYWKTDFVQVTPENINNAKNYIRNTHAGGGMDGTSFIKYLRMLLFLIQT